MRPTIYTTFDSEAMCTDRKANSKGKQAKLPSRGYKRWTLTYSGSLLFVARKAVL